MNMKITNDEIDSKFTPELWEDIDKLSASASNEDIINKLNDLTDYVNYLMRFIIGKTD
jgi:hypothetical protein|tara:strand:- start:5000 stop:5173 length:174 start_codon:yes stop_codon:yes gene_type:complete